MAGIVDEVNRERSRYEQIKRFTILPRDFEMEDGEVTPTLKLKRRVVLEHFADEVEGLYAERRGYRLRRSALGLTQSPQRARPTARARADVGRRVPGVVEARDLDDVARVRRVDELPAADVHAHVAEAVEEDEVARLELVARDEDADAEYCIAALCGSETPTCA